MASAELRSDGRVEIPKPLRHAPSLFEGDESETEVTGDEIPLRPRQPRDPEQWWYWTEEWQAAEREMEADVAEGRHGLVFSSGTEFLAALREVAGLEASSDSTAL